MNQDERTFGSITATTLLDVWERGYSHSPLKRGLLLLSLAFPEEPFDLLAQISIGDRDRALIALRQRMFGPLVQSLNACPNCGERFEVELDLRSLPASESTTLLRIEHQTGERLWKFRLPCSGDLLRIQNQTAIGETDAGSKRRNVLAACLVDGEKSAVIAELPKETVDELSRRMAEADPSCSVAFDLSCEHCQRDWGVEFDIVSFLWAEIDGLSRRLMVEVHRLARAYGWGNGRS